MNTLMACFVTSISIVYNIPSYMSAAKLKLYSFLHPFKLASLTSFESRNSFECQLTNKASVANSNTKEFLIDRHY